MSHSNHSRLKSLRERLKQGLSVRLETHLPGAELVLSEFGMEDEVFCPPHDWEKKSLAERKYLRARFRSHKNYVKKRKELGEYKSRQQRMREKADKLLLHGATSEVKHNG